ncbi:MAG TPA: C_GCAxxG_C_C family protein [Desulfobacteraceae bacterium]|nr:C_GCAxxG_C_C family protein [Desulfobacteraceae bacterium]
MGQEKMGMRDENAVRAVGAFAGGIAGSGNVCGILLGGVAVISSLYSRGSLDEKENPRLWAASRKFLERFQELAEPFGGISCRDIAGVNWQDREAVREYYADRESTRKNCIQLVGEAAHALGVLLEEAAAEGRDNR